MLIGIIIVLLLLLILFITGYISYNASFNRYKTEAKKGDNIRTVDREEPDLKWLSKNIKTISITNKDNLNLKGYVINKKHDKWMILAHGYTSNHISLTNVAKRFSEMNYNVLLLDLRSHGRSEGKYITMGVKDAFDLKEWINYIIDNYNAKEIGLYGVSMGAATVMTSMGLDLPNEVKYVIEDCGYTSVKDQLSYIIKKDFHLPSFPFYNISSFYAKILAKYSYTKYSPVKSLKNTNIPILMIHGDNDTFVPFYMLDILYNSCNSYKEKLVIKGAIHAEAQFTDKEKYWNTIKNFLDKVRKEEK